MLRDRPENVSWAEIEERIHFLAAVEMGRQEEGMTVAHEEVKDALAG